MSTTGMSPGQGSTMAFRGFLAPGGNESPAQHPAPQSRAPGTRIGYDPLLLKRLQADHQRMLELFTQTQELLTTHDYEGVKRKLGELGVILQGHLTTGSVR